MELYDEEDANIVEEIVYMDLICDNCNTLAAQKISGTAGHSVDVNPCPWCHCLMLDVNRPKGYDFDGK